MSTKAETSFQEKLHARFREQGLPLLWSDGEAVPAASLWTGSRLWVGRLRDEGMDKGSTIWVDLAPSPAVIQVLLAAWWLECHVVLGELPRNGLEAALDQRGCDLAVACLDHPSVVRPKGLSGPARPGEHPGWDGRPSTHAPWRLEWDRALRAFLPTGSRELGATAGLPRAWTDEDTLVGHVLPALADGALLVEEGSPAARAEA